MTPAPRHLATAAMGLAAALALSACSTTASDPGNGMPLAAELEGANEVPRGAADGTGGFEAALAQDGELCYELFATGIEPATAAHIHRGGAGENGPPVVPLEAPQSGETAEGCTMIEGTLAQEILGDPAGFYVNVHNEPYPDGAIRGQLVPMMAP
ncbi:CHRD domain-containing protein [Erythrobacter sp. HL-111]|uniref:CHRD domain-containing protein n=1 Tax=Erythrobacter sp. HL-111 TaxID=1798193 RepID=UPI0006DB091A|nr:CHRD domain-containing protein [Erythrobacter sp. HL-111]KPP94968.1 MAG: CHRD domain [Erythrobacteraceae bacterium HL-111]SDS14354.1 CHRD domain-containing protein [Erythrobacter sp. HL-111]